MFSKSARFYDAIYSWKDYAAEAEKIRRFIGEYARRDVRSLLDVACGTGAHLAHLQHHYSVEGLDLDPELLEVARDRLTNVPLHRGDMTGFDLGRRFDAVTCLFSAIGYAHPYERLTAALASMARHLEPGGVLLVEPWLKPDQYRAGTVHSLFVDEPELRIARINVSEERDGVSLLDFHYLVGTPAGVDYFVEHHELGLYSHDQYMSAFETAGLTTSYDEEGTSGRGLYIAAMPGA